MKNLRILALMGALVIGVGMWFIVGPQVKARISHQSYNTDTYSYDVEVDTSYNQETGKLESNGILVSVHPEQSETNTSAFSSAYWAANQTELSHLLANSDESTIDAMIIFSHPLSSDEANSLIGTVGGEIFESAVVGYVMEEPYAGYHKENGQIQRDLNQLIEDQKELVISHFSGEIPTDDLSKYIDVRGYMAIRIVTKISGLKQLEESQLVRQIDITPYLVSKQLSEDVNWKNAPINSLAIEMPVWAYDWK